MSKELPQLPFCIEKMMPGIGESHEEGYYRHSEKEKCRPGIQGIDGLCVKKGYQKI